MIGEDNITTLLLDAGADSSVTDDAGTTPADIATLYGFHKLAVIMKNAPKNKIKQETKLFASTDSLPITMHDKDKDIKIIDQTTQNNENEFNEDLTEEVLWAMQMQRESEEIQNINNQQKNNNILTSIKSIDTTRADEDVNIKSTLLLEEETKLKLTQAEERENITKIFQEKARRIDKNCCRENKKYKKKQL